MTSSTCFRRLRALALLVPIGLIVAGCGQSVTPTETTSVPATPDEVLDPGASEAVTATPTDAMPGEAGTGSTTTTAEDAFADDPEDQDQDQTSAPATPTDTTTGATASLVQPTDLAARDVASVPAADGESDAAAGDGTLVAMDFEEFRSKAVANPDAKLTMVDAWATWCGPCKENFPHLVEMSKTYADQGLQVVSLSFDDPSSEQAIAEARAFLREQGADFPNILLDEEFGVGFEQFDFGTIPAVFLFDPSGNEIRRFTFDDPNNQFTYDEVEQVVATLLKGETLPEDAPGFVYQPRSASSE